MTSVVTPWRTFGSWSGSAKIISPEWLCRSMNPGQTTRPDASMRRPATALVGRAAQHLDAIAPDADRRGERQVAAAVDHRSARR